MSFPKNNFDGNLVIMCLASIFGNFRGEKSLLDMTSFFLQKKY